MTGIVERKQALLAHVKKLTDLEEYMRQIGGIELEVKHYFAPGTYTRELIIPKDIILTGEIHREACINILSKGKMRIVSSEGLFDLEAPHVFVSQPGEKKGGVALEDSIWINVFPWNGTDTADEVKNKVTMPVTELLAQLEDKSCQ